MKGVFFQPKKQPSPLFFQPKLTIGPVDDIYEREADAVADQVMRMSNVEEETIQPKTSPLPVQRMCAECEEEEELQRKEKSKDNATLEAPPFVNRTIQSGGKPMDDGTRSFMENRIGYDFSNVKVHTDQVAAKSAQSINALAYTTGNNIVFNEGQYVPSTQSGKRLLAHELTHVVQQGSLSNQSVQRFPENDPVHGPILDQFSAETGIPRDQASQHSPEYQQWLSSKTQGFNVNIDSSCNRADIIDIVNQSLTWLDDVYHQLLEYDADEVFKDVIPPRSNHARIAGALQQAFNTTDRSYVEVIRRRFLHVAQTLRTNGRITINCNGPHCTSGGASFTAAYVSGPYALTMCSIGTTSARPIATFIHELTHAIIPQIGISNDVSTVGRIRDRAYRGDRVFQHLSPEETLDNADSYGILAELLHTRVNTQLVTQHADTEQSCTQPNLALEAFARADQWNSFALDELDLDVTLLQGAALNTLVAGNLAMLNRAFPNITTTAQLTALRDAFQLLNRSGFDSITANFKCVTASDSLCGSSVAYSLGGKVSSSSVTLQNIRIGETARICPDWFSLSADDRIRTIYAAFMIGRPAWIVAGFQLQDALDIIDGAKSMTNETIPAPTTRSAREHVESDERSRRSNQTTP